jgi:predicted DCC family thiol-disulfide oxidoreductase YuxK
MTVTTAPAITRVTVLYDASCNLCRTARAWLERQVQVVPLEFLPAASPQARERYPFLDPAMTLEDLTVVGDGGEVWVGAKAWVVCLWALDGKRGLARRLSSPALMPRARAVVSFVSRHRRSLGTYGEACDCTPA